MADAVAQAWQRIDEGLKPIIGPAGVAALYQRSLHLRTVQHPWLAEVGDRSRRCVDAAPLRAALARLQPVDAATVGGDLLQTFHELLTGMVGQSLTERLLRPVWADLLADVPGEDEPR